MYYVANTKPILKTALISVLIQYPLLLRIFVAFLVPADAIGLILPAAVSGYAWLIAVVLMEAVRAAFLEPLFMVMVALTFHNSVHNQPINEEWAAKLESVSSKFAELNQRALQGSPAQVAG